MRHRLIVCILSKYLYIAVNRITGGDRAGLPCCLPANTDSSQTHGDLVQCRKQVMLMLI